MARRTDRPPSSRPRKLERDHQVCRRSPRDTRRRGIIGVGRQLQGHGAHQRSLPAPFRVKSWIGADRPPIYFGFGNMPVDRPAKTVAMIANACCELGERALICSGGLPLGCTAPTRDVMILPSVNHVAVLPRCRAIVHHGSCGATAASVRSGVPTLILWIGADQPVWAKQIKRLAVGTLRRFSGTTQATLRHDLQTILGPICAARAREVGNQMTPPSQSLTTSVALFEELATKRA